MSPSQPAQEGSARAASHPASRPPFVGVVRTGCVVGLIFAAVSSVVLLWWSGVSAVRSSAPGTARGTEWSAAAVDQRPVPGPDRVPAEPTASGPEDAASGVVRPPVLAPRAAPATEALAVTGLVVAFTPYADAGAADVRIIRMLALTVPAGTSFSPCFAPGPFRAAFTGEVEVDVRERYTFSFEGAGELELRLGDKVALQGVAREGAPVVGAPIRLSKGKNRLVATYTSPVLGDARLRVLWSTSEFKSEPIPPTALSPGDVGPEMIAGVRARRARDEIERLQCLRCHAAEGAVRGASAPDLRTVGSRLHAGYVFEWLLRPVRRGFASRQMPHFFAEDASGRQQAADVTAYLASLSKPSEVDAANGSSDGGGQLFAQLGCVACHTRPGAAADAARVDLDHVPHKWRTTELAAYLASPQAVDPGTAMPDFRLTGGEAAALARFLLGDRPALAPPPPGDTARGRQLVSALGCAACHDLPEVEVVRAPAWSAVAPKIDATTDLCGGPPRYAPAPSVSFADATRVLGQPALAEAAERAVVALACAACHARDGVPDAWARHEGEVADLMPSEPSQAAHPLGDQSRPSLTWAGEKMRSTWSHGLFAGSLTSLARPWLQARMPAFPAHADVLAQGLACSHGVPRDSTAHSDAAAGLAAIGAGLVSMEKGFACVTCHGVGDRAPTQVFEVQGINFALAAQRLRADYFLRWMRNPQRVDPSSKMPRYGDAQGKTAFAQILDGDAEKQFDAIWAWLVSLR